MMKILLQRTQLKNGLVLLVLENHQLPLISLTAFVSAGLDQNPFNKAGLASLTARLLDDGTQSYTAHEISEIFESAGGILSTFSERELSGISLQIRQSHLAKSLDLLKEMLLYPTFPRPRFELERRKMKNYLRASADDPQVVGANLFNQWIYLDSPLQYPSLGTEQSLDELKVEEVRDFHLQKYTPQQTIIVAVGAINKRSIAHAVRERFSDWERSEFCRVEFPKVERQTKPILDEYFMEKEQVSIFLGHLGVTRRNSDYHTLQVMDVVLGNGPGFTSRIPRKLRDDQGLAYSTYSDISSSSGIYPGHFVAFISTSPENRRRALDAIRFEIENIVANGISSEELLVAQNFLTGSFVFEFQSNASIARFLLSSELFDLGADYSDRYPDIINGIDCKQVHRVARKYLDTINYTTVVVGPSNSSNPRKSWSLGKGQAGRSY